MGIYKKITYLLCGSLLAAGIPARAQQTIQFSQYVFNGLAINPAYAGYKEDWSASLSYRLQWAGIDGAPRTGTVSLDGLTNDRNKNIGIGVIVTTDKIGPQNTSSVYGNYAYRVRLDEYDTKRLCFGIGIGATQYSVDGAALTGTSIGDGSIPAGHVSKIIPDLRAGAAYYSPGFYLAASLMNGLAGAGFIDNTTAIKQVRHMYVTGGALIPLNKGLDLKPSFLIKEDFNGPTNLDLTAYLAFNKVIWAGASWRARAPLFNKTNLQQGLDRSDVAAALVQLYYQRFRLGYSYDFTTSKLSTHQNGSHEISFSMAFKSRAGRVLTPRYF
ncbi:PorP/SprF family type IX secretion system membrane protein [Hufsiella ginkgonis]|uniref:Type IX secretion system membrane protein PorP/SprF n=1 Tax=Hufsiella ginkgonis TaxID=2695274 RepID=A0A7K1XTV7_9SPHI|nr:type IX secretion system membrane protein PorP/SprF [Hufsiella ginkgonis]MXV14248.1 type IX secretion system membrane protein PorP/SprF [Hufsiella ginkgonis]